MNNKYLTLLREIKSTAMATVDENGIPQVRIIDIMLIENDTVYFCTARGKDFHHQLLNDPLISILGLTAEYQTIRLTGKVEKLTDQHYWIDRIFDANPVMKTIYPDESRYILDPFCISKGTLEYFDLSSHPIYRESSSFGGCEPLMIGFEINDNCISCGMCAAHCPQQCITSNKKYMIQQNHCLLCGYCQEICPVHAINRRG